jgi:hypothetical protein
VIAGVPTAAKPLTRGSLSASALAGNMASCCDISELGEHLPGSLRRAAPMLHLTFTESGAGTLRQALLMSFEEAARGDKVLALADDLSYGPIDPPEPTLRLDWMIRKLNVVAEDWNWLPKAVEEFWWQAVLPMMDRTIWFSRRYTKEYAGFLQWVARSGHAQDPVVDLSEVEIRSRAGPRYKLVSLSQVGPEDLDIRTLLELRRPLTEAERGRYLQEWRQLQNENAALRVIDDGRLVSVAESYYDALILSFARPRWLKVARIVGDALATSSDAATMQVGDVYLAGRIAALVSAGQLEAQGDLRNMRRSEVRLPVTWEPIAPDAPANEYPP